MVTYVAELKAENSGLTTPHCLDAIEEHFGVKATPATTRDAYPYVRQSTPRQVAEHGESTRRQCALRDRAIAAGWAVEQIHVNDAAAGEDGQQGRWVALATAPGYSDSARNVGPSLRADLPAAKRNRSLDNLARKFRI